MTFKLFKSRIFTNPQTTVYTLFMFQNSTQKISVPKNYKTPTHYLKVLYTVSSKVNPLNVTIKVKKKIYTVKNLKKLR